MESTVSRLALNSLSLLGFRADQYCSEHPQLRSAALDAHTFDKGNEKSLLLSIHFLLSQLYPDFEESVSHTWPYYDAKGKNMFKVAAQERLNHLAAVGLVPSDCCKASVLSSAKGFVVWKLLWKLSNEILRKMFIDTGDFSENSHRVAATTQDLNELRDLVAIEHNNMLYENNRVVRRQREQYTYADELWARFRMAKKNIEKFQRDILSLEMGEDTGPMLLDTARIARTEMTMRIESSCVVLQKFSESGGFVAIRDQIRKGASIFPQQDRGQSSSYTAQYIAKLNNKIMQSPRDRRVYAILDEYDINEHLDILIDKLKNSNSVVSGIPGSDFDSATGRRDAPLQHYNQNDDGLILSELLTLPDSIETIKSSIDSIHLKMEKLKAVA